MQTAARESARTKQAQLDAGKEMAKPLESAPPDEEAQLQTIFKKQANFQEVIRLRAENYSIHAIARQTGLNRQTIKKYLGCDFCLVKSASLKNPSPVQLIQAYFLSSKWGVPHTSLAQLFTFTGIRYLFWPELFKNQPAATKILRKTSIFTHSQTPCR